MPEFRHKSKFCHINCFTFVYNILHRQYNFSLYSRSAKKNPPDYMNQGNFQSVYFTRRYTLDGLLIKHPFQQIVYIQIDTAADEMRAAYKAGFMDSMNLIKEIMG